MKRVLELAEVKAGDTVYDLGSGDGRWLFYFSKNTAAKEIVGYEISIIMYLFSRIKKLFGAYPRVKIIFSSLYKADLSRVDIVLCFLMPNTMKKIWPKLQKQMKPGSKLVSYAFKLSDKVPEKISKLEKNDLSIYVYKF